MAPTALGKKNSVKEKKSKPISVVEAEKLAPKPIDTPPSSKILKRKKSEAAISEPANVEDLTKVAKKSKTSKAEKSTEVEVEVEGKSGKAAKISKASKEAVGTSSKKAPSGISGKASKAKPVPAAETVTAASIPIPSPVPSPAPAPAPAPTPSRSKKSKKAPSPEPEPAADDVESDASDEKNGHLHGFSTDDDDSSDEEDAMNDEPSAFDVSKLPTIAKDDATVKRKLEKAKNNPTEYRGVLFISRLPHGFYEDQMKAYFSQFGNVTRLRLSRNKKTGRSKHYGFIEFESSSVAQIVADTMDNYLLMGHILRCKVIPKDEVHPELWVGANRKWRVVPQERVTRAVHNRPRTDQEQARAARRLLKRQTERNRKLEEVGIKYDFEAVSYKIPKEKTT